MKKHAGLIIALLAGAILGACEHVFNDSEGIPLPRGIEVVVVDSCEYIRAYSMNGNRGVSIVHKANCRNHGGKP